MIESSIYRQLFQTTLYFNSVTFGGGYVIIPLIIDKYVKDYHWLEEDEMMSLVSIAQSTPGPFAVNACVLIGYRVAGLKGAFVSAVGSALPAFVFMTLASFLYGFLTQFALIDNILIGMQAGVAAIIVDVVIKMARNIINKKDAASIITMVISIIAAVIFDVSVVLILLFGALVGLVHTLINNYRKGAGR